MYIYLLFCRQNYERELLIPQKIPPASDTQSLISTSPKSSVAAAARVTAGAIVQIHPCMVSKGEDILGGVTAGAGTYLFVVFGSATSTKLVGCWHQRNKRNCILWSAGFLVHTCDEKSKAVRLLWHVSFLPKYLSDELQNLQLRTSES